MIADIMPFIKMVGAVRFERTTFRAQGERSTSLSYAPKWCNQIH